MKAAPQQVATLNTRFSYLGYTSRIADRAARLEACAWLLGLDRLDSTSTLTTTQIGHLLRALADIRDRAGLETMIRLDAMTEAELDNRIRAECDRLGLHAFHVGGYKIPGATAKTGSSAGYVDWTIAGPGGVIFRESKAQAGRVRKNQAAWHQVLRQGGADVAIWRPSDLESGLIVQELERVAGRK